MSHAPQFRQLFRVIAVPLFLLPMAVPSALAQVDVRQSHQGWSTDEGLPDASVHQIFQSRDGFLWLATEGGVVRFDGSAFYVLRHETQPAFVSNDIGAIAQDASGALWFGTADGLVQARGSALRRFSENDGLPSSAILSLAAPADGSLLVLTSAGLVRFDGAAFHPVTGTTGTVFSLQPAPDGTVWLLTSQGLENYGKGGVTAHALASEASAPAAETTILGLQFGPGGFVWTRATRTISATGSGVTRSWQIGRDVPAARLTTLYVDRQGTAWIGTNRGLFYVRFDLRAGAPTSVQTVESLRLDSILSVTEDREGNMWIGTETSGLHALRPRKFRSEPAAAGETVAAGTAATDGSVWFGTREDGVRKIQNGVAQQPVAAATLTSPVVLSLAAGKHGDVWVGTPDGLNHIAGKHVQQFASSNGLPDDFVRSVLVDSAGRVWAGTRRGLARVDGSKVTVLTRKDGLGSDSIGPLLQSTAQTGGAASTYTSPDVWVGTAAGLSHLSDGRIESFSSLSGNAVTAIADGGDGTLWVGLHGTGLSLFGGGRFTTIRSPSIPAEITSLFADRDGYLWVRGVRDVVRVSLTALRACAAEATRCGFAIAEYGVAEGMPSDAAPADGIPGIWQAADGELWFATRKGIAIADPAHFPLNLTPPPVMIERFLVDDVDVPIDSAPDGGTTHIGPGHNRYTFEYAALSFTLPSRNRYRTMLEGLDRDWIDMDTARSVSYTSLPPREYRFRVQAQNNDGVWSQAGAEVRFHVLPPIYRRGWFYVLVLLISAAFAIAAFRLRLKAVQRRFDLVLSERSRMAREIHDTLAQDFVSVSLQLDLAAQMLTASDTQLAASQLQATRKLVRQGLESARQSIWDLRANASTASLPARLKQLADRYAGVDHPPGLKVGGAYRKLSGLLEDNVLRIAQEGLANSYRHSGATDVSLQLRYDPDALRLDIVDNGRGFSPEAASRMEGHYGLRGIKERAASLGASLTIDTSPGEGVHITLLVPLSEKKDGSA